MPTLRLATPDDLPLLVSHRRRMWEDMGGQAPGRLDAADPVYRRWLRPRLARKEAAAWVVEARGEPVASGVLWVMRIHPRPNNALGLTPYLMSMFCEPAHRGKGHATRIVRAAIRWAKAQGHGRIMLHASEAGRPVYEKLGFTRTWEMKLDLRPGGSPRAAPRRRARRSRSAR